MKDERSRWAVIEDSLFVHVLPVSDTQPHGFVSKGAKETTIAGMNCPCKPRVEIGDKQRLYNKAAIYHNSFEDEQRINDSMKTLIAS